MTVADYGSLNLDYDKQLRNPWLPSIDVGFAGVQIIDVYAYGD